MKNFYKFPSVNGKKSQLAIEYVILMGVAITGVIIFIVFIYDLQANKTDEKIVIKMNDFSYTVQNEIILASQMNDGYNRILSLPEEVENINYTINNTDSRITITYNGQFLYLKIPKVNGSLIKGNNLIKKYGDDIIITPIN